VGDAADDIHVTAHVLVKFPPRLFSATLDEVAEQGACPVDGIGRDIGH
jgi:hypothetical protein